MTKRRLTDEELCTLMEATLIDMGRETSRQPETSRRL